MKFKIIRGDDAPPIIIKVLPPDGVRGEWQEGKHRWTIVIDQPDGTVFRDQGEVEVKYFEPVEKH